MKRIRFCAVLLCALLILPIIGCNLASKKSNYSYCPQSISDVNYNNFTTLNSGTLITSDAVYYSDHTLDYTFYKMTESGSEKLFSNDYSGDMFLENDKLYICSDNEFEIYDVNSHDKRVIHNFGYECFIKSFFVLDGIAYLNVHRYMTEDTVYAIGELYTYNSNTDSLLLLSENVASVGVMNGTPVYLTQNDKVCALYEYDYNSNASNIIGAFEFSSTLYFDCSVNYTSSEVIICDCEDFVIYDLNTGDTRTIDTDLNVLTAIAFENYMYLLTSDDKVSRLCIETGEVENICSLKNGTHPKMFVTSDTDVYVILDDGTIRLYHPDGTHEAVTNK